MVLNTFWSSILILMKLWLTSQDAIVKLFQQENLTTWNQLAQFSTAALPSYCSQKSMRRVVIKFCSLNILDSHKNGIILSLKICSPHSARFKVSKGRFESCLYASVNVNFQVRIAWHFTSILTRIWSWLIQKWIKIISIKLFYDHQ